MARDVVRGKLPPWADRSLILMPVVGFLILIILATSMIVGGAETWHFVVIGVAGTMLTVGAIRVRLFGIPKFIPRHVFFTVILAMQSVGALVIGGAQSFGFIILVPTSMLAAWVLERRYVARVLAVPSVAILAMAAAQLAGADLVPRAFTISSPVTQVAATALVALVAVTIGGALGRLAQSSTMAATQRAIDAQSELATAMEEQNRQLVGLTGAIAHELKNPLAAIQGLSKLMDGQADEAVDSKLARRLRVLVEESERMARILEEFLNFSRPVTDLSIQETRLSDVAKDVAAMHEGLAGERQVALTIDAADEGDRTVRCDPRKIKQVLINLVQNALDVAPTGSAVVMTVAAKGDDRVRVTVDDTGPGLTETVVGRVFDAGVTTKGGGTGLGLTIARSIAQQHGGQLTLDNRPEGGCHARLELPVEGVAA